MKAYYFINFLQAYAKVHGNYFALKTGFCENALMDFTGCPMQKVYLQPLQARLEEYPQNYLDRVWETLVDAFENNYIMNVVPGPKDKHRDGEYENDNESFGL